MRRVNGEVCGTVELLVGPDIAEFPAVSERMAGLDFEPDNSQCAPPHLMYEASLSSIRGFGSPIGQSRTGGVRSGSRPSSGRAGLGELRRLQPFPRSFKWVGAVPGCER